jgi:hypothetical protein
LSILPGGAIDELFQDGIIERDADDEILDYWADLEPFLEDMDELSGFQLLEVRFSISRVLSACNSAKGDVIVVRLCPMNCLSMEINCRSHAAWRCAFPIQIGSFGS